MNGSGDSLFLRAARTLVGVVHVPPLPGSPRFGGDLEAVLVSVAQDARALAEGGADAIIVENFGDAPFFKDRVPPETIAGLTRASLVAREAAMGLPLGINVLRNDAASALGIASVVGASFVRINVHCGAMLTDQGLIEGRAAETLRLRRALCPEVRLVCDVQVKHAVPLGGETLADAARDTRKRGLADVLVISGRGTGEAASEKDLALVREALPDAPLWVGSGLSRENLARLSPYLDGALVGTSLKAGGRVEAPVEAARVAALRAAWRRAF